MISTLSPVARITNPDPLASPTWGILSLMKTVESLSWYRACLLVGCPPARRREEQDGDQTDDRPWHLRAPRICEMALIRRKWLPHENVISHHIQCKQQFSSARPCGHDDGRHSLPRRITLESPRGSAYSHHLSRLRKRGWPHSSPRPTHRDFSGAGCRRRHRGRGWPSAPRAVKGRRPRSPAPPARETLAP